MLTHTGACHNNAGAFHNNAGVLFTNAGVFHNNAGAFHNNAPALFTNAGAFHNNAGVLLTNAGVLLTNAGAFHNNAGALLTNAPALPTNAGVPRMQALRCYRTDGKSLATEGLAQGTCGRPPALYLGGRLWRGAKSLETKGVTREPMADRSPTQADPARLQSPARGMQGRCTCLVIAT